MSQQPSGPWPAHVGGAPRFAYLGPEGTFTEAALLGWLAGRAAVTVACTTVAVLYAGRLAEARPVFEIFASPAHPYTTALIDCIPRAGMVPGSLTGIPGAVPGVARYPAGCRYHPRCPRAVARCQIEVPEPRPHAQGMVACHLAGVADA